MRKFISENGNEKLRNRSVYSLITDEQKLNDLQLLLKVSMLLKLFPFKTDQLRIAIKDLKFDHKTSAYRFPISIFSRQKNSTLNN